MTSGDTGERPNSLHTNLLREEYETGGGYLLRWEMYEYADDPYGFYTDLYTDLGLQGSEAILDIGCGKGGLLETAQRLGHVGLRVGIDNAWNSENNGNNNLTFGQKRYGSIMPADASVQSPAESTPHYLPFRDNCFDIVFALFMLYHMDEPERTVREAARVLSEDGSMIVATSAADNKTRHRAFELVIANSAGAAPPPIYAEPFNTDRAEEILPMLFEEVEVVTEQFTTFSLTEEDIIKESWKYTAYMQSLKSMGRHYSPQLFNTRINTPLMQFVYPTMLEEAIQEGRFTEQIHRKAYRCRKPTKIQ